MKWLFQILIVITIATTNLSFLVINTDCDLEISIEDNALGEELSLEDMDFEFVIPSFIAVVLTEEVGTISNSASACFYLYNSALREIHSPPPEHI